MPRTYNLKWYKSKEKPITVNADSDAEARMRFLKIKDPDNKAVLAGRLNEIDKKTAKIIEKLYKSYGTDSGILFGISDRGVIEAIIKFAVERTTVHLCGVCKFHIATCSTKDIVCGEGIGNDNVIRCGGFEAAS